MSDCRRLALVAALILAAMLPAAVPGEAKPAEDEEANQKVLQVWSLYDAGEYDRALQLAEGIHGTEGYQRLVLTSFLGFLYEEKGRNEEALSRLDSVKPALREALAESAGRGLKGEGDMARHRSLLLLYSDVLRARGFIYFQEGRCDESVPELKELMAILRAPNPLALTMIGTCLYREKKYDEAREYFEESHRWYEQNALRGEAAYNVAAMYAVQGKEAESAQWLEKALADDRGRWLEKLAKDSDFDAVRTSEVFRKLTAGP